MQCPIYNDHELPTQLSPDQYFQLNWALKEDRQDLNQEEESLDGNLVQG